MKNFPSGLVLRDEHHQIKDFSRQKLRVLAHLDVSKLDLKAPLRIAPMGLSRRLGQTYGKGRVFYSTLGHEPTLWDSAPIQQMILNRAPLGPSAGGRRCDTASAIEPPSEPAYLFDERPADDGSKFNSSLIPSGSFTRICSVPSGGTIASRNGMPAACRALRVPSKFTPLNAT